jgi:hypothetical protein
MQLSFENPNIELQLVHNKPLIHFPQDLFPLQQL